MTLVGRQKELARLLDVYAGARAGSPGSLAVVGGPGQGKTALVSYLIDVAGDEGSTVLRGSGVEFESELPFSTLACLLTPVLPHLCEVAPHQARSLRAAVDATAVAPGLTVYGATLALFGTVARRHPVVVVVDDLHWVDRASLDVLLFCARRLRDERLCIVFGSRDERRVREAGLATIVLGGLTVADATILLASLGVDVDVARRIAEGTGGNPLALHEIAQVLTEPQRTGHEPLPEPLPIGDRLVDAYAPRLLSLPDRTRHALLIAAIETSGDMGVIDAVCRRFELHVDDLDPAVEAGLVTCRLGELRWVHPLARAAAFHRSEPRCRRAIHRAIGDSLDEGAHASRVAWHLASSVTGPDEAIAGRLEAVGAVAVSRGALLAAADAFDWSARLSDLDASRIERWHRMAESLWSAGETIRTLGHLDAVLPRVTHPEQRARLIVLAGQADVWHTGPIQAAARLERAAAAVEGAPHLAAILLSHAAVAQLLAGDSRAARTLAARARHAASRSSDAAAGVAAAGVAGVAELLGGDAVASDGLLDPLRTLVPVLLDTGLAGTETLAQLVGLADVVTERWHDAETLLRRVMRIGDERGLLGLYGFAASQLADLLWRSGRWSEAAAELTHLVSVTVATDQPIATHYAFAHLALLDAGRGMSDSCCCHAGDAISLGDRLGMGALSLRGHLALGLLALGTGRPADAARQLDVVAARMWAGGNCQPASLWWQADHVEALVGCGRQADAFDALEQFRDQAATAPGRWSRGALHRAEALVGPRRQADEHLSEALAHFGALGARFETARTLLLRGERRVADGGNVDGLRDVAAARRVFDDLGARGWSERATDALGRRPSLAPDVARSLTPAELRIARAVSNGESNRLAAERLHLSVKTIDYHLQNIYRKLSLKNRTHLAKVLSDQPEASFRT
jgi:DNA-binding CsgD family transcriptional regulator